MVIGLQNEPKTPVLAWTSLAAAAVALLVVLTTKRSPKRDAVLFMICGMGGGVFIAASTVGFPGSLPMWLWAIGTMCIGTVAIVVDAESAQSKPRSDETPI